MTWDKCELEQEQHSKYEVDNNVEGKCELVEEHLGKCEVIQPPGGKEEVNHRNINNGLKSWFELVPKREERTQPSDGSWETTLGWFFFIAIFIEYVYISILELSVASHVAWRGMVIICNVLAAICPLTLILCGEPPSYFRKRRVFWKLYYKWLHFIASAIYPLLGYLILDNFQGLVVWILQSVLLGLLFLATFEVLEDVFYL